MKQFWRVTLSIVAVLGLSAVSVSGQTGRSNRQQELYDQYYGVGRGTTRATTGQPVKVEPQAKATPVPQPDEPLAADEPAQSVVNVSPRTRVRIGARGGVLIPALLNNNTPYSAGTDFVGGVMLVLGSGRVQFQPEVNYSRTVFRNRFLGTGITRSATDQVVVPLLARFSVGNVTGTQFYVNAGPYSAYETSTSLNGLKLPFDRDEQRVSYGAAAGLGVAIRTGPGHIGLDLRGRYRLTTANQVATEGHPNAVYTEATLSYLYPLGRR